MRLAPSSALPAADKRRGHGGKLTAEPLADLQWDMQMIHATVDGSYAVQPGSRADSFNAVCQGTLSFNGFYGEGIVDALRAVTYRDRGED